MFDREEFYRGAEETIPVDMTGSRGKSVSVHLFIDAEYSTDKVSRMSQIGILVFLNRAPVMWSIKKQNLVQNSTFGSEFPLMKQAVDMTQDLMYKMRMFGVPIGGPTNMYYNNEEV